MYMKTPVKMVLDGLYITNYLSFLSLGSSVEASPPPTQAGGSEETQHSTTEGVHPPLPPGKAGVSVAAATGQTTTQPLTSPPQPIQGTLYVHTCI